MITLRGDSIGNDLYMEEEETLRGQGCEDKGSPQFSLIHELRVQESGPLAVMDEPKGGTISYSKP